MLFVAKSLQMIEKVVQFWGSEKKVIIKWPVIFVAVMIKLQVTSVYTGMFQKDSLTR